MTPQHIQIINHSLAKQLEIDLIVYRLDIKQPIYSGNKFYKLSALQPRVDQTIVSFGGQWSNHLLALSLFGAHHGLQTIGLVRQLVGQVGSELLDACKANGMQIIGVSAGEYRQRDDVHYQHQLQLRWPEAIILPEGGSSRQAMKGCEAIALELLDDIPDFNQVILAVGTGATMAGVCRALPPRVDVLGVPVVKKFATQASLIREYLCDAPSHASWQLERNEQLGKYGELKPELIRFIHRFEQEYGIPLDPNYAAKAFYYFFKALAAGRFKKGGKIVLLHTGGLFGRKGFPEIFGDNKVITSD